MPGLAKAATGLFVRIPPKKHMGQGSLGKNPATFVFHVQETHSFDAQTQLDFRKDG